MIDSCFEIILHAFCVFCNGACRLPSWLMAHRSEVKNTVLIGFGDHLSCSVLGPSSATTTTKIDENNGRSFLQQRRIKHG